MLLIFNSGDPIEHKPAASHSPLLGCQWHCCIEFWLPPLS